MKRSKNNKAKGFSLKDRFGYWFDNRMAKGSLTLIKILIVVSVILAVIIAGVIILCGFNEEGEVASVFWNSIATVINAWMPYYEEGSIGYLILMSVTAIAGVLFTSVLIGIITSAIEERIGDLKRGNSRVLETGHIVLLGFYPGEYTLLRQLILAADEDPVCILVAEDTEREEMEQEISENLDVPKNVRIVCRTVDITDPASLVKCSLETSASVIVNPTDDMKTLKTILAVNALLEEKGAKNVRVSAILSNDGFLFPATLAKDNNISTFHTKVIIAKMIAHSCTQTGLSETFREVFDFDGCEFYFCDVPGTAGVTFGELAARLDSGVPAGVYRDGKTTVNPPSDFVIKETDRILVFTNEDDPEDLTLKAGGSVKDDATETKLPPEEPTDTLIFGYNETLPVIMNELPENVTNVRLSAPNLTNEQRARIERVAENREYKLTYADADPKSEAEIRGIACEASHILILNDYEKDPDEADMEAIFLFLNLREIRKNSNLGYNITVELQKENAHKLVSGGEHTDFIVSSSMSSLILAQLAESPELIDMFREILSNTGNELYLKNAAALGAVGTYTAAQLRHMLVCRGYVMLGYLDAKKQSRYNLPLDETVTLTGEDYLIVLGRS